MISLAAALSILSILVGVKGSVDLQCTRSAKLDLQLIVDSSASVGEDNFRMMMQKIADDIVGQFDIGKDKTRVSLFKYSSHKVMVEEFNLDAHTDAASLKKAINAVKYEAGWTNTGMAMEKALTHYSKKMRNDKETAKACIIFTDGIANDENIVPAASKAWKKKGVTVFAMGIGKGIEAAGLEDITGSANRFIQVPDFKAIGQKAASLLKKICEEVIIPLKPGVKTVDSATLKCTRSAKLDLQLIVDSSGSIGVKNFRLMLQKIADDIVGRFDIGKDKTRVSLFKYSNDNVMVEEFNLDAHTDAASLKKAINAVKYKSGRTMTGMAMEKALVHYAAKMRNDKTTAKACIVFTDGKANDRVKVPAASKAWMAKGVTVFALGIGRGIKAAGLKDITGSPNRFIQVPDFKAMGEKAASLLKRICEEVINPTKKGYQSRFCSNGASNRADVFPLKIVDAAFAISSDSAAVGKYIRTAYQKAGKIPRAVIIKPAAQYIRPISGDSTRAGHGLDCVVHGDRKIFIVWKASGR